MTVSVSQRDEDSNSREGTPVMGQTPASVHNPLWPEGTVTPYKIAVGHTILAVGGVGVGIIKKGLGSNPAGVRCSSPVSR